MKEKLKEQPAREPEPETTAQPEPAPTHQPPRTQDIDQQQVQHNQAQHQANDNREPEPEPESRREPAIADLEPTKQSQSRKPTIPRPTSSTEHNQGGEENPPPTSYLPTELSSPPILADASQPKQDQDTLQIADAELTNEEEDIPSDRTRGSKSVLPDGLGVIATAGDNPVLRPTRTSSLGDERYTEEHLGSQNTAARGNGNALLLTPKIKNPSSSQSTGIALGALNLASSNLPTSDQDASTASVDPEDKEGAVIQTKTEEEEEQSAYLNSLFTGTATELFVAEGTQSSELQPLPLDDSMRMGELEETNEEGHDDGDAKEATSTDLPSSNDQTGIVGPGTYQYSGDPGVETDVASSSENKAKVAIICGTLAAVLVIAAVSFKLLMCFRRRDVDDDDDRESWMAPESIQTEKPEVRILLCEAVITQILTDFWARLPSPRVSLAGSLFGIAFSAL